MKQQKVIRHPSSKLSPSLLANLLSENASELQGLFVVLVSNEGDYEIHVDSDMNYESLCVVAMMVQAFVLETMGGDDEDDEDAE